MLVSHTLQERYPPGCLKVNDNVSTFLIFIFRISKIKNLFQLFFVITFNCKKRLMQYFISPIECFVKNSGSPK